MSAKTRAKKIKLLLLDVDGVMTDGRIFVLPAPAGVEPEPGAGVEHPDAGYGFSSDTMMEAKGFHAHDGTAISLARLGGIKTGIITKRLSRTVALRARDLRLDHVYQGVADKLGALEEILAKEGLAASQVAFVGDDVIDLPVMRRCGLAIAVPNARKEVIAVAHYVTRHGGGKGAVRDAVEYILRAQGTLEKTIRAYIRRRSPARRKPQAAPGEK